MLIADAADHKLRLLAPTPTSTPPPPPPPAPGPPVVLISSPPPGSVFTLHHAVTLNFACQEGTGGPGLQSCSACEIVGAFGLAPACAGPTVIATSARLDTATLGTHRYVVTARSSDGLATPVSFSYVVQRTRPLVYSPPDLLNEAIQPCVMYPCRANPGLHLGWEIGLSGLAATWCAQNGCQHRMDLLPVHGFDDNLFPFNPDWAGFVLTGQPPYASMSARSS